MDQEQKTAPERFEKNIRGNSEISSRHKEFRSYILAWLGIIVLTAFSFILSQMKIGEWKVLIALLIAGTQAALALYYFMHLRDERARIFRILIPLVLIILVVFMALTFSDVAFRG